MTTQILNKRATGNRQQETGKRAQRTSFGVALAVSIPCCLFPFPSQAQDAQTLVSQMQTAEKTVSFSAIQKGRGGTARLYRSGLKQRLEWLEGVRRGDVLVDDGQHVTLYHRAEHSATQTDSRARAPAFVPSGAAKLVQVVEGSGSAFRIPLTNGRAILIDAQTKLLLAVRGGNNTFTLSNIKVGPVPAAKFNFAPPPGVAVQKFDGTLYTNLSAAKRAARWLKTPSQLPPGWKFESAIAGQSSAWLRFSNRQSRLSLFEQPTTGPDLAPQKVEGGTGTFWKSGGVRILATGVAGSALDEFVQDLK